MAQIVARKGFDIDTIYTSKKILPNAINCHKILSIQEISVQSINDLTHLFVLTGPPYHHDVLKKLAKSKPIEDLPLIWVEKPFYLSRFNLKHNLNFKKRLYVDYPYSPENAAPSFTRIANKYSRHSEIEINVFSRYNKLRDFDIVFDFIPHIVPLMSFFVNDLESLKYSNWRIKEIPTLCPETGVKRLTTVYAFEAISESDDNSLLLRFGINNPQPSFLTFKKRSDYPSSVASFTHDQKSSCFMHLGDAFSAPVDQNVRRFLAANPRDCPTWTDPSFHELIFRISCAVKFGFDQIKL